MDEKHQDVPPTQGAPLTATVQQQLALAENKTASEQEQQLELGLFNDWQQQQQQCPTIAPDGAVQKATGAASAVVDSDGAQGPSAACKLEVTTKMEDLEGHISVDELEFRRSLHVMHDQSYLLRTVVLPALDAAQQKCLAGSGAIADADADARASAAGASGAGDSKGDFKEARSEDASRTQAILKETHRHLLHTQCNLLARAIADGERLMTGLKHAHSVMSRFDTMQPQLQLQPQSQPCHDNGLMMMEGLEVPSPRRDNKQDLGGQGISGGRERALARRDNQGAGAPAAGALLQQLPSPLRALSEQILPPVAPVIPQRRLRLPIIVAYSKMYYDPFWLVVYDVARYSDEQVYTSQVKVLQKHHTLAQMDPQVVYNAAVAKRLKNADQLETSFMGFAWEMLQEHERRDAEFRRLHPAGATPLERAAYDKDISEWLQANWEPRMMQFNHDMERELDDLKQRAPTGKQLPRRVHKVKECAWISKHRIGFLRRTFVRDTGITPEEQRLLLTYWINPKHKGGAGIIPGYQRFGPESAACRENLVSDATKGVKGVRHNGYTLITPMPSFNTNDKLFLGGDDQLEGLGMTMAHFKSQRADWEKMKRDPNLEILPMQDLLAPGVQERVHRLIVKYDLHDEFLHDFDRLPENRIYKPVKVQGPPPPKTAEGEIVQTADVLTKDLPGIGTWIEDENGVLSERVDTRKGAMNKSGTGAERLSSATKKRAQAAGKGKSKGGAGTGVPAARAYLAAAAAADVAATRESKKRGRPSNAEMSRRLNLQLRQEEQDRCYEQQLFGTPHSATMAYYYGAGASASAGVGVGYSALGGTHGGYHQQGFGSPSGGAPARPVLSPFAASPSGAAVRASQLPLPVQSPFAFAPTGGAVLVDNWQDQPMASPSTCAPLGGSRVSAVPPLPLYSPLDPRYSERTDVGAGTGAGAGASAAAADTSAGAGAGAGSSSFGPTPMAISPPVPMGSSQGFDADARREQ